MWFGLIGPRFLIRRTFYHFISDLTAEHRSRIDFALACGIAVYSHRLVAIAALATTNFTALPLWYDYRRWDPFMAMWKAENGDGGGDNRTSTVAYLYWASYMLEAFHFYTQWALFTVDGRRPCWRWWRMLVVDNQDSYRRARLPPPELRKVHAKRVCALRVRIAQRLWGCSAVGGAAQRSPLLQLLLRLLARAHVWLRLENIDRRRYFSDPLPVVPHFSRPLRTQLILWMIAAEQFSFGFQVFAALAFVGFFAVLATTLLNLDHFTWFGLVWFAVELAMITYNFIHLLNTTLFLVNCSVLGSFICTEHIRALNRSVWKLLRQCRTEPNRNSPALLLPTACIPAFRFQLTEHIRLTHLVIVGNRTLFGRLLFVYLLTNLPLNIYLIRLQVFTKATTTAVSATQRSAIWIIAVVQMVGTATVIGPLARSTKQFHNPARWIPLFQLLTGGGGSTNCPPGYSTAWRWLRLKLDDLHQRLTWGPKLAVGCGPVTAVTYVFAFEFLFLYIGYLLMAFSKQMTGFGRLSAAVGDD